MKKVVPMQKEIIFRMMIGEITEIAIEKDLTIKSDDLIAGNLTISGKYKMTGASQIEEEFYEVIPVEVELSNNYNLDNLEINLEDFYYEIINENILRISVNMIFDNLEEIVDEINLDDEIEIDDVRDAIIEIPVEIQEEIHKLEEYDKKLNKNIDIDQSIFKAFDHTEETFSTYHVYIVRENDSLEMIMDKYKVTKEELANYNNIDNILFGSKLIIPTSNE